jgi:hypothetical protein
VVEFLRRFMVKVYPYLFRYLPFRSDQEACHEWKIRKYEAVSTHEFLCYSIGKDSEIAEMTEVTYKEDTNTGLRYIQSVKGQKFKEEWCKEMKWVSFNHNTGVVRCANCALFSELADCNSKVANGFSAPFKKT